MINKFITFEGPDGSGKTTQSKKLYHYLESKGFDVIHTREIGGTDIAEKIRDIVVNNEINKNTELFLVLAARSEHIEKVIKPALLKNKIIICDRFVDSTAAYQSKKEGDIKRIFELHNLYFDNLLPDITFYMKISPNLALQRTIGRQGNNKYEEKGAEFLANVILNYDHISELNNNRIKSINSSGSEDEIFQEILNVLNLPQ